MYFWVFTTPRTQQLFLCVKDILIPLNLSMERLQGYCFDGVSNMSGRFKGVQARLKEVCPDSVYVHCTNHSLDQEVAREVRLVADTLNFVREVTATINESAKRKALYQSLFGCGEVTFRTMESDKTIKGETRAKVAGLVTKAISMRTVFGLLSCVALFSPSLQGSNVTALGSMESAKLLCHRLSALRQDATVADLVGKTKEYAARYNLRSPQPPRVNKTPAHYRHMDELEMQELDEESDVREVKWRFDQEGIRLAARREQAVIEAAQGNVVVVEEGCQDFTHFHTQRLSLGLAMLGDVCNGRQVSTIQDVVSILQTLQPQTRSLPSDVEGLIKQCLSLPISVAALERSFSALRRLKTWLRSTMSQERLTHLALMNAHCDILDELHVPTLMKTFIQRTTERRSTFGNV
ncbi:hypothetical protein SKAU_G00207150 [Synaphobranchus kaupii]|uniref:HAT C-terminal dimerisation domain-containing protein n=1 Tax=Synaphobranchus kaupii TaxID=118154 RepID=A0A9Q1IUN1_SYNKA|nr:hypothetical protein SKAU_G00207150 [Synaphobranchus kaupii]